MPFVNIIFLTLPFLCFFGTIPLLRSLKNQAILRVQCHWQCFPSALPNSIVNNPFLLLLCNDLKTKTSCIYFLQPSNSSPDPKQLLGCQASSSFPSSWLSSADQSAERAKGQRKAHRNKEQLLVPNALTPLFPSWAILILLSFSYPEPSTLFSL